MRESYIHNFQDDQWHRSSIDRPLLLTLSRDSSHLFKMICWLVRRQRRQNIRQSWNGLGSQPVVLRSLHARLFSPKRAMLSRKVCFRRTCSVLLHSSQLYGCVAAIHIDDMHAHCYRELPNDDWQGCSSCAAAMPVIEQGCQSIARSICGRGRRTLSGGPSKCGRSFIYCKENTNYGSRSGRFSQMRPKAERAPSANGGESDIRNTDRTECCVL